MNSAQIRALMISALMHKTDAKERVYSPRDWATSSDMYPLLLVQTPFEQKVSLGRNAPQFTTVTTVRVTGRLDAMDGEHTDNGARDAEIKLEALREQVERAVINSYELTRQVQQFKEIRSTIEVNADGDAHVGQLTYEIDIEYYQGPEEFYEINTESLEGIDTTIAMPDGTSAPLVKTDLE